MNSVETLIRNKLKAILAEEKRRIARSLISEMPDPKMVERKAKKQEQIKALQLKISALQAAVPTSKDPSAMKERLDALRKKVQLANQELGLLK